MIGKYFIVLALSSLLTACITQFKPEIEEKSNMLVVEGMITDQYRTNKIKISRSFPVGKPALPVPVKGCEVSITDEDGVVYSLKEVVAGTYITDSVKFCGHVGGKYTLTIKTGSLTYMSDQMEMVPVPRIDSVFYEKRLLVASNEWGKPEEGCQIYINTYDPSDRCFYYRWDYNETWEINLHWGNVVNPICWLTQNSDRIFLKDTREYNEPRITKFPLRFISNKTDMLSVKYSILVNQYSLNEEEYYYWEQLQRVMNSSGGLYDFTPSVIKSNIYNVDDPEEVVLGYFSVSATTQKRLFIKDKFAGLPNMYWYCPTDTVWGEGEIIGLNDSLWLLEDFPLPDMYQGTEFIRMRVITKYRECSDCTTRGSNVKPSYWDKETLF